MVLGRVHCKTSKYTIDDNYRTYKRLFKMFKEDYPNLWVRGTSFEPYGYVEIRIFIPGKGKLIYNPVGVETGKIRWEEKWEDVKKIKQEEREKRPDMYQTFLNKIYYYQKTTGVTQGDIAELSGISRQSINKYLSGAAIPKVSTMKIICKALGIDI